MTNLNKKTATVVTATSSVAPRATLVRKKNTVNLGDGEAAAAMDENGALTIDENGEVAIAASDIITADAINENGESAHDEDGNAKILAAHTLKEAGTFAMDENGKVAINVCGEASIITTTALFIMGGFAAIESFAIDGNGNAAIKLGGEMAIHITAHIILFVMLGDNSVNRGLSHGGSGNDLPNDIVKIFDGGPAVAA